MHSVERACLTQSCGWRCCCTLLCICPHQLMTYLETGGQAQMHCYWLLVRLPVQLGCCCCNIWCGLLCSWRCSTLPVQALARTAQPTTRCRVVDMCDMCGSKAPGQSNGHMSPWHWLCCCAGSVCLSVSTHAYPESLVKWYMWYEWDEVGSASGPQGSL